MSKKLTKEDIKNPDKFIEVSDRVGHWIERHRVIVFTILGVLLALGGTLGLWEMYTSHRENQAQSSIYEIQAKVEKIQANQLKKEPNKNGQESSALQDNTIQNDYGNLLTEYEEKIEQLKSSRVALIAGIHLVSLYLDYAEYGRAFKVLQSISPYVGKGGLLSGLIHLQMGTVLVALEKYDDAKASYERVLQDKDSTFLHSEAVLKSGLMEEKQGHLEQARSYYQRASEEFASTDSGKTAKAYLRLLELNKGK